MAENTPEEPTARRQRWGAYAVIVRDGQILLSRLAPRIAGREMWTLPGGGIEFGEHPRDALVREIHEETGLSASVGEQATVVDGTSAWSSAQHHAVRLIFDAWVPADSPEPHVVEVDGSTVEARWWPLAAVLSGDLPLVGWLPPVLAAHAPVRLQRVAAYGVARRGDRVLLTRISPRGHSPGTWTLPGGGVDHGESPADSLAREFAEETGLVAEVGALLGVHDTHFTGTAPSGRNEDFHGIHLLYAVSVSDDEPRVVEVDGTTDAAEWVPVADIESGDVPVFGVVREALRISAP